MHLSFLRRRLAKRNLAPFPDLWRIRLALRRLSLAPVSVLGEDVHDPDPPPIAVPLLTPRRTAAANRAALRRRLARDAAEYGIE